MRTYGQSMAVSTARKIAAVLFAVAMVGSVAVGPALADDDDVSVGGDGVNVGGDDGTTVSAGDDNDTNGSATVDADVDSDGADGSVEVSGGDGDGTDGSVDCDLSSADCETSGGDEDGGSAPEAPDFDGLPEGDLPDAGAPGGDSGSAVPTDPITTPEVPVDAPDLPVSYTSEGIKAQGETVVPFAALPDFCNPPYGVDDVQENNPVDPTDPLGGTPVKEQLPGEIQEPPSTPVGNPLGLVGAPIGQCEVFNPYDPAVNPTSPPDDPSATVGYNYATMEDGVILIGDGEAITGEDGPGGETFAAVVASQDYKILILRPDATDSQSRFGGNIRIVVPGNSLDRSNSEVGVTAFSRSAALAIDCDGSECKPTAEGVPSGESIPAFPAGGDDDGDDGGAEPNPSADTDEPVVYTDDGRVVVFDDRDATLDEGLPGGENGVVIISDGEQTTAKQNAQGSQGNNSVNVDNDYRSGEYPGDDDARVVAKANGAGVVAGFECDEYRCSPTQGTGVYAGPAGMLFEMLPDNPTEE